MAKRDQVKERLDYWREQFDDWREILPEDEFKKWYRRDIAEMPHWGSVERAAEYFDLNAKDPIDSTVLLRVLAHVLFAKTKKGRKKGSDKWDHNRLCLLGSRNVVAAGDHYMVNKSAVLIALYRADAD